LQLIAVLRESRGLHGKREIRPAARAFGAEAGRIRNGDDAAALPDPDGGYTLFAAEGMQPSFVEAEPWFAGLCAVLTNVSDIAAMGGRSRAIVDVLFAGDSNAHTERVLEGLRAGSEWFGVPIVGGHTGRSAGNASLSAAVLGKAKRLITSFDARPGQQIMACVDLGGRFRGDRPHFDGLTGPGETARDAKLARARLDVLPQLSEAGLVAAGKDISMAGILGTLLMLLETSGCGAQLDLAAVPAPACAEAEPRQWLEAFPSFGYLLAVEPANVAEVRAHFAAVGVTASPIAELDDSRALDVTYEQQSARYWDLANEPLMGFGSGPLETFDTSDTWERRQHA
jgi:AIR synthase-related protein